MLRDGGYDDGYSAVPCFWGTDPGSLIVEFLKEIGVAKGSRVLDLGCGEGKNAVAFSKAGCLVDAVDCSDRAIENGRAAFPDPTISWLLDDVSALALPALSYAVVVSYGLLHCLRDKAEVQRVIEKAKDATIPGGHHIVCTFNDRSHDLRGHPGFAPLLLEHNWYLAQYASWETYKASDRDLVEAHPHNHIRHHHSVTRLVARKPK